MLKQHINSYSKKGILEAQYNLSYIQMVIRIRQDYKKAIEWYEKQLNSRYAKAQYIILELCIEMERIMRQIIKTMNFLKRSSSSKEM